MLLLRTFALMAATATFGLVGCAQAAVYRDTHHPDPAIAGGMSMLVGGLGAPMVPMDEQMKEMQESMVKMGAMGSGGMNGKGGMGAFAIHAGDAGQRLDGR